MIKFHFKQLLAEKEFQEDRCISLKEIAEETKLSRVTLSKIASKKGYNTTTDNIEKLCRYFKCTPGQFMSIQE